MAKSRSNKRKIGALKKLQGEGLVLCALGLMFLISPQFLGASPSLKDVASGLTIPGWLAVAAGGALLALHHIFRTRAATANPSTPTRPQGRASAAHRAQKNAGIDDLERLIEPNFAEPQTRQPETRWSPAVFAAIEWRRFEAVCERVFRQAGFHTQSQSHGADGGVDIWLHSANAQGPVAVVQCKHWQGKPVGVKEVREFLGVMASHGLKRGTYATTSTYTTDARQFARDNGINALDGRALLALIGKRTPDQQQELLDVAFEGEYWRPTCASCGTKLAERASAKGGAWFWGCRNYPRCKSRLPMVAAPCAT